MHNSEYKKPVRIVYIVGGSLNWAMKLMGDLAHDGTIPATIKLYDIDHAAAARNAAIGMRYSAASDGAKVGYHAARAEEIRAADALSDPLVQPIGPNKTTTIFRERVAATRHYLPEELTSGVAA
jgi:alpha-galactosidase/6-phospho-beta-glucosidase family protein